MRLAALLVKPVVVFAVNLVPNSSTNQECDVCRMREKESDVIEHQTWEWFCCREVQLKIEQLLHLA
eukprot:4355655-Amphidinium_carterae.1